MAVNVGKLIREARKAKGLSLAALGRRLNLNASTICRIENGRSAPKATTMRALAAELNLSVPLGAKQE